MTHNSERESSLLRTELQRVTRSPKEVSWELPTEHRILWADGKSSYDPNYIEDALYVRYKTNTLASEIFVTETSDQVKAYNRLMWDGTQLRTRQPEEVVVAEPTWPEMDDVVPHVKQRLEEFIVGRNLTNAQAEPYIERVMQELEFYEKRGLIPVLQACFRVINTLEEHQITWGAGRGSSVASFVLFLLGIHDIDSVKYDIPLTEFFGDVNE